MSDNISIRLFATLSRFTPESSDSYHRARHDNSGCACPAGRCRGPSQADFCQSSQSRFGYRALRRRTGGNFSAGGRRMTDESADDQRDQKRFAGKIVS